MNMYSLGKNIVIRAGIFFITVFLLFSPALYPAQAPGKDAVKNSPYYLLIIDAGSSGSRLYVYKIKPGRYDDIPEIVELSSKKVEPGISDSKNGPGKLKDLIGIANQEIPEASRKKTKLFVLATAGMRLLKKDEQQSILEDVTAGFKNTPYDVQDAKIISGRYEGLYAWLAVNYLDDRFDPSGEREGLVEMGGASTQIAFLPQTQFENNMVQRRVRGNNYRIYSKSYLYLGQDEVIKKFKENKNCFPLKDDGEVDPSRESSGNFDRCVDDIYQRFRKLCEKEEGSKNYCILNEEGAVHEPKVAGYFFATSSFYYNFSGLGMPPRINLDKLTCLGKEWCDKDGEEWGKLKNSESEREFKFMKNYCFLAAYFRSLLENGYGFGDYSARILSENGDVSWTLGAALDIVLNNEPETYDGSN